MVNNRYFQNGQKVTVRAAGLAKGTETFSALLAAVNAELFIVTLPYPVRKNRGQILFPSGTEACVLSEAFGLGIQVNGQIEDQIDENTLSIRHCGALEMFPRRKHYRIDTSVGIVVQRSRAPFATLRQQWAEAVQRVAQGEIPKQFSLLESQQVNLSAGGIGISLKRPVMETELSLLLLDIGDGKGPIWTLGEVVWARPPEGNMQRSGLRFVQIEPIDMQRINDFVIAELKKQGEDVVWYPAMSKKLDRMEF